MAQRLHTLTPPEFKTSARHTQFPLCPPSPQVRNIVDASALRDLTEASALEGYALPKMYRCVCMCVLGWGVGGGGGGPRRSWWLPPETGAEIEVEVRGGQAGAAFSGLLPGAGAVRAASCAFPARCTPRGGAVAAPCQGARGVLGDMGWAVRRPGSAHLDKRRPRHLGQPARNLRLAAAGGPDHQQILGVDLLLRGGPAGARAGVNWMVSITMLFHKLLCRT